MGINSESDIAANLQIGPTSMGMVRIYIEGEGVDLPLDFDPDEAEEIAEELRSAPPPHERQDGSPIIRRTPRLAEMRTGDLPPLESAFFS